MNDTVLVDKRNEYGQDRYYPANKTAELLAGIADTATLTKHTLRLALEMGFEIRLKLGMWVVRIDEEQL